MADGAAKLAKKVGPQPPVAEISRQVQAGVVMDTHDMSFYPSEADNRHASVPPTSLAEVVARDYAA